MSSTFPTTLDTFTSPSTSSQENVISHAGQHANHNDSITALETKVGVDSSAVTTTLDYKLKNSASIDPGHLHTSAGISGQISVAKGGTGAATLTGIVKGNGTSAFTAVTAPSGTIVGTTDSQTLTNKIITDSGSNVMAKSLKSATTTVDVSAATAPSSGQALIATSSTTATWQSLSPKRARVYKDANQSINNSTSTTLTFNQETFDTDTMHDTVTNNSRITINTAGVYFLKTQVAFASNATGVREVFFMKNGGLALASAYAAPMSGDRTVVQVTTLVEAVATDYFEVQVNQSSGGALNVEGTAGDLYYQTHFEAVRLGPTS